MARHAFKSECNCMIPDREKCVRLGFPDGCYYQRPNLLTRFLCVIGCHDWRDMNGVCCECQYRDPLWRQ